MDISSFDIYILHLTKKSDMPLCKYYRATWNKVYSPFKRSCNESIYEEMNERASIFCTSSTMCPPQCVLFNVSFSMRLPHDASSSMRPSKCVLLNASSFMSVLSVSYHYECNKVCSQECVLNLASLCVHHNQYIEVRILRSVLLHRMLIMLPANKRNPFNCNKDYRPRVSIWICLVLNCLNVNFFILQH